MTNINLPSFMALISILRFFIRIYDWLAVGSRYYRVSNLKLSFSFGLLWRYGKCYDFGLLVCYTIDLRQFFGAKKPDRKWPEMTKNDLSCKNSIFDWFWTFVWSRFFGFLENATSIFHSRYTWDIFFGMYRVRKCNL